MGTIKYKNRIRKFFHKTPVVSIASLKKFIGEKNSYVYLLLNQMVKKKEIYRLARGKYSLSNDPTLIVFCFKPAYLGLQDALSIHNLWEQETNTVILTTKIVREGIREINESNVLIKRLPNNLFFGVETHKYGDYYFPVSDIEKTFLDLIYFKQPINKKLINQFKKRINQKKLKKYLLDYDAWVKEKVQTFF